MGYVYLICDNITETYKIGMSSKHPEKRLKELQTGNSNELFLITFYESTYYKHIENMLHKRYNYMREHGEWFNLRKEEIETFNDSCSKIEETHKFLLENNSLYK